MDRKWKRCVHARAADEGNTRFWIIVGVREEGSRSVVHKGYQTQPTEVLLVVSRTKTDKASEQIDDGLYPSLQRSLKVRAKI